MFLCKDENWEGREKIKSNVSGTYLHFVIWVQKRNNTCTVHTYVYCLYVGWLKIYTYVCYWISVECSLITKRNSKPSALFTPLIWEGCTSCTQLTYLYSVILNNVNVLGYKSRLHNSFVFVHCLSGRIWNALVGK